MRARKSRVEQQHQVAFVAWFRKTFPDYAKLLTIASFGENVGEMRMAMLKGMGLTPGYPDLFLALPKMIRHIVKDGELEKVVSADFFAGLYIEMKTEKGTVTPKQRDIHALLRQYNYKVEVCRSFEEAKDAVDFYISSDE